MKDFFIAKAPFERRLGQGARRFRLGQGVGPSDLENRGALLEVQVDVPVQLKEGATGSTPQTIIAMVDTGASITAILKPVAAAIGLIQTGQIQVGGVGGSGIQPTFSAALKFGDPSMPPLDPVEIAGIDLPGLDFQMLIGRDILKYLIMTYDGPRGAFAMAPGGAAQPAAGGGTYVQPAIPIPGAQPTSESPIPALLVTAGIGAGALYLFGVI